jgi:hypothetical protein
VVGGEVAVLDLGHGATRIDLDSDDSGRGEDDSWPGIVTWPSCPMNRIVIEPSG